MSDNTHRTKLPENFTNIILSGQSGLIINGDADLRMSTEFKDPQSSRSDERLRNVMGWVAVVLIALFAVLVFGLLLWRGVEEKAWLPIAQKQFAAVIGLPTSAIAALFVVLILRLASGPIEVEFGAFKFKGAAAPIVFWLLCFFAMAAAIKLLWVSS